MEFLQRSLDDETATPCGRCDNCAGAWYPTRCRGRGRGDGRRAPSTGSACRSSRGAQWPTGVDRLGVRVKGRHPRRRASPPKAAPSHDSPTSGGATHCARSSLPAPPMRPCRRPCSPRACGCSPSGDGPTGRSASSRCRRGRRPQLVDSLARGFAEVGRLPYLGALTSVDGGPSGEPGGNSAYRLAGLWGRFAADALDAARRPGAARRRPRRQPLDRHGRRTHPARGGRDCGAALRARPARMTAQAARSRA